MRWDEMRLGDAEWGNAPCSFLRDALIVEVRLLVVLVISGRVVVEVADVAVDGRRKLVIFLVAAVGVAVAAEEEEEEEGELVATLAVEMASEEKHDNGAELRGVLAGVGALNMPPPMDDDVDDMDMADDDECRAFLMSTPTATRGWCSGQGVVGEHTG